MLRATVPCNFSCTEAPREALARRASQGRDTPTFVIDSTLDNALGDENTPSHTERTGRVRDGEGHAGTACFHARFQRDRRGARQRVRASGRLALPRLMKVARVAGARLRNESLGRRTVG
jgi:hypothetical protein